MMPFCGYMLRCNFVACTDVVLYRVVLLGLNPILS
jgi:hypothetical protein